MGWDGGCMGRGGEWTCSGQRNAHPRWLSNALGDPDRNWQLLKKTRTISSGSAAPSWSALQVAIETSQSRDTGKRLMSPVSLLYISLSSADIFPSILSRFSRLQQVPDGQISECIYSKTYVYIDRQTDKQTDRYACVFANSIQQNEILAEILWTWVCDINVSTFCAAITNRLWLCEQCEFNLFKLWPEIEYAFPAASPPQSQPSPPTRSCDGVMCSCWPWRMVIRELGDRASVWAWP